MSAPPASALLSSFGLGIIEPVRAPWIRPGLVVHASASDGDRLVGDFAAALRARGFGVVGSVSCADAPDVVLDLESGVRLARTEGTAERYLRHAMRENADLLVIGRLEDAVVAAQRAKALIGNAASQGIPLLTLRPDAPATGDDAGDAVFDGLGTMIAARMRALWAWWGADRLYRDLALGVAEDEVVEIAAGPRWMMIEGPSGSGLAYLPRHPRDLTARLREMKRRSLRELATLSSSWDTLEMAIGIAAVNAHYNRTDIAGHPGNGVRRFRDAGGQAVVVGAFPGIDDVLPGCAVIETAPRPGEYPLAAMDLLLPDCGAAVINSSALINRGLPRMLRLTEGRRVAVIGPSTPLTPRLHSYGIEVLGGLVVTEPKGLAAAIRAGALPREFAAFGRFVHLVPGTAASA